MQLKKFNALTALILSFLLLIFTLATDNPMGRLHGEIDGATVQSNYTLSWTVC